jgi:hypothetical protein
VGELVTEHRLDRGIVEIAQHALRDRDRVRPLASRAARGCLGGVIPHNFTCGACSSCVRVSPRSKNTCGVNPNAGGEQRGGELLDAGVVLRHRIVEEAASEDCGNLARWTGRQPKC